tara:strand:- start:3956 stop:5296 length:1341 start_codon:yes stop_codon:yes gene_type:complete
MSESDVNPLLRKALENSYSQKTNKKIVPQGKRLRRKRRDKHKTRKVVISNNNNSLSKMAKKMANETPQPSSCLSGMCTISGGGTGASSDGFSMTDPINYLRINGAPAARQNSLLQEITGDTSDIQKDDVILFYRLVTSNIGVVKSKEGNMVEIGDIKTMNLNNMEGPVTNGGVQNINTSSDYVSLFKLNINPEIAEIIVEILIGDEGKSKSNSGGGRRKIKRRRKKTTTRKKKKRKTKRKKKKRKTKRKKRKRKRKTKRKKRGGMDGEKQPERPPQPQPHWGLAADGNESKISEGRVASMAALQATVDLGFLNGRHINILPHTTAPVMNDSDTDSASELDFEDDPYRNLSFWQRIFQDPKWIYCKNCLDTHLTLKTIYAPSDRHINATHDWAISQNWQPPANLGKAVETPIQHDYWLCPVCRQGDTKQGVSPTDVVIEEPKMDVDE